jgi:hypothetical protein
LALSPPSSALATSDAFAQLQLSLCLAGGVAVATNSAGVSQPFLPPAALNFSMPFHRIFLEREPAIVVDVELVEVAPPRGEILHRLDLAVLVLVVT